MESVGALLPLILLVGVFYLLILRPARKRQAEAQQIASSLAPGAEVMTAGGIYGTVVSVGDGEVQVEVSPGTTLRMVTGAIAKVVTPAATAPEDASGASLEPPAVPPVAGTAVETGDDERPSTGSSA